MIPWQLRRIPKSRIMFSSIFGENVSVELKLDVRFGDLIVVESEEVKLVAGLGDVSRDDPGRLIA